MDRLVVEADRRLYLGVLARMLLSGPVLMTALVLPQVAPFDWRAVGASVGLFGSLGLLSAVGARRRALARHPAFIVLSIVVACAAAGFAMLASRDEATTASLALVAAMAFQLSIRRSLGYTVLAWCIGSATFVLAHGLLGAPAAHLVSRTVIFSGLAGVILVAFRFLVVAAHAGREEAQLLARLARVTAVARDLAEGVDQGQPLIRALTGARRVVIASDAPAGPATDTRSLALPLGVSSAGRQVLVLDDAHDTTYIGVITDLFAQLCERDRVHGELLQHSRIDPVTGVANRRVLDEAIADLTDTATRTVVMLDLDHFKDFNDRHGHLAGDDVLHRFGSLLLQLVRPDDRVARYGGEEFCLLLRADVDAATAVVDRIRDAWSDESGPVTFSAGIAPVRPDGMEAALASADGALYAAKAAGRDRTEVARREP